MRSVTRVRGASLGAPRREAGIALAMALVVLLLVSIALALVATSLRIEMERTASEVGRVRLTALADAALAESLARLASNPAYAGLDERELDGGTVWSDIVPMTQRRSRIEAGARFRGHERHVEAEVLRTKRGLQIVRWRRVPGAEANDLSWR